MNNIKHIERLLQLAEDKFLENQRKIVQVNKELSKLTDEKIGLSENIRSLKETLAKAKAQDTSEEITAREVEIARMKGFELVLGDKLTDEIRQLLKS